MSEIQLNTIYNEDCLETMKRMPDNFVDITVTSPPYDNLRNYNGFELDWHNTIKSLYRITKDGGVVVWVVGDSRVEGSETGTSFKQALWAKECGFNLHDTMIFQKASPPIIPTAKCYQPNFEYMFVFSKGTPKTFNPIRIPKLWTDNRKQKGFHRKKDGSFVINQVEPTEDKVKENIWHYAVSGGNLTSDKVNHPAMFPEKLARDHIISWSNVGDLVYDPFMGSGTTAKMALKANRKYIGSEISKEYCEIAESRLKQEVLL